MSTDDALRIGDAERQRAIDALAQALADGRIVHAEFDERSSAALTARTRGDVRGLLADLMSPVALAAWFDGVLLPDSAPGLPRPPGYSWDDPLVLRAKWDNEIRRGVWEVPPFLELVPIVGSVKLDLTAAKPMADLIDVVVEAGAGDVLLVMPEGWGVDTTRVEKGMGSIKNSAPQRARPGRPQLVVRGQTGMGSLKVRRPTGTDAWLQKRALAKQADTPPPELPR